MISVHEDLKYVCVWGASDCADVNTINEYVERGYRIITFNNGNGNIMDCMKAIVRSYNQL